MTVEGAYWLGFATPILVVGLIYIIRNIDKNPEGY